MWTEEKVKEFTRERIDKDYFSTASSIVLISYYYDSGWRFDKMRAFVEQQIQIIKQFKQ